MVEPEFCPAASAEGGKVTKDIKATPTRDETTIFEVRSNIIIL
jgi:hypothetical protein